MAMLPSAKQDECDSVYSKVRTLYENSQPSQRNHDILVLSVSTTTTDLPDILVARYLSCIVVDLYRSFWNFYSGPSSHFSSASEYYPSYHLTYLPIFIEDEALMMIWNAYIPTTSFTVTGALAPHYQTFQGSCVQITVQIESHPKADVVWEPDPKKTFETFVNSSCDGNADQRLVPVCQACWHLGIKSRWFVWTGKCTELGFPLFQVFYQYFFKFSTFRGGSAGVNDKYEFEPYDLVTTRSTWFVKVTSSIEITASASKKQSFNFSG